MLKIINRERGPELSLLLSGEMAPHSLKMLAFGLVRMLPILAIIGITSCASDYKLFWKSGDEGVYAIDNAFGKSSKMLKNVLNALKEISWAFTVDKTSPVDNAKNIRIGFKTKYAGRIGQSRAVTRLHSLAKEIYAGNNSTHLVGLYGRIIERGDFNPVIKECENTHASVRGLVILTESWKKNNYGEISIYDKNGEILKSIHPRYGRTVFIPCNVQFKISPPSINVEVRHYFLFTEFGGEIEKPENQIHQNSEASLTKFFHDEIRDDLSSYEDIDAKNYLTRKFITNLGRKVFVYDNAIPAAILETMRKFIVNHADYYESPVVEENSADNVKWIISLDEPEIKNTTLWLISKQLLFHIGGKEYHPYDLSCNHIRRTDTTFKHRDTYDNLAIYTLLIYLNPGWSENNYGETTFFENNEMVAAVRPKYGRVVIFDGRIDHSAHPSSPELPGARYTFAIKSAPSLKSCMTKLLENDQLNYKEVVAKLEKRKGEGNEENKSFVNGLLTKLYAANITVKDVASIQGYLYDAK